VRIGLVNDMPIALEAMRRALALAPQHQIIWTAADGAEAVDCCRRDLPDLVLMDLLMPKMGGVEATRRIMAETPCAILLVTACVDANTPYVFDALGHGALDAIDTPVLGQSAAGAGAIPLLQKIAAIDTLIADDRPMLVRAQPSGMAPAKRPCLVAIGASAGGPAALAEVLQGLPCDFPACVVIVQHIDENFAPGLVMWLQQQSAMPVRIASDGEPITPGTVLMAMPGNHLKCDPDRLRYSVEPASHAYRPSIDVFFNSIDGRWAGDTIGVLLSGMGRDGAQGLKALRDHGHHTIAQDRATSAVYGMPAAAAKILAAIDILPLQDIAPRLIDMMGTKTRKGNQS
jgi:two-component system response regulator WspF